MFRGIQEETVRAIFLAIKALHRFLLPILPSTIAGHGVCFGQFALKLIQSLVEASIGALDSINNRGMLPVGVCRQYPQRLR